MKCPSCGAEDKNGSKFCKKCGTPLKHIENTNNKNPDETQNKINMNILIISVAAIICVAIMAGAFVLMNNNSGDVNDNVIIQNNTSSDIASSNADSNITQDQKSWKLISTYDGVGSGSKEISVPAGDIRLECSAYPIKNYADNYLEVYGENAQVIDIRWDSHSPVETRYDSFEYSSDSREMFNISYYETDSWEVNIYKYC